MKSPSERHLERANVAAELGRYTLVVRECRAALALGPQSRGAHELLGWALMEQRRYPEALTVVNDGVALGGEQPHLHYVAAVVLHRMGFLPAARIRAETAVRLAPRSARYKARLARVALDEHRTDEAVALAREALELGPRDPFVLGEAVLILSDGGRGGEALEIAKQRAVMEPDSEWALAGLLRAQLATRAYADAAESGRAAIRRNPNLGWIWGFYAEALDGAGRHGEADDAAREAVRLNPETVYGGAALVRVLCEQRAWRRAESVARAALETDPKNPRLAALLDHARRHGVPLVR